MSIDTLVPYRFILDTVGDQTGSIDAAQNFASPTAFIYKPPTGWIFSVESLVIIIEDSRVDRENRYGDISGGVSPGIRVEITDGTTTVDLTSQQPVQTNLDWLSYATPNWNPFFASNEDFSRWRVLQLFWVLDQPGALGDITLNGNDNEQIQVVLEGNYSPLDRHQFIVSGIADIPL